MLVPNVLAVCGVTSIPRIPIESIVTFTVLPSYSLMRQSDAPRIHSVLVTLTQSW